MVRYSTFYKIWKSRNVLNTKWYGTVLVRENHQQHIIIITCDKKHPVRGVAAVMTDRYRATESGERTYNANGQIQDRSNIFGQITNDRRRTHGEKFVKSGERTDNAHGQIQDRLNIFTGSIVSPPTHPQTNNLRPVRKIKLRSPVVDFDHLDRFCGQMCTTPSFFAFCTLLWPSEKLYQSRSG